MFIQRNCADRSEFVVVHQRIDVELGIGSFLGAVVIQQDLFFFLSFFQLIIAMLGEEPLGIDDFGTIGRTEFFCAF